MSEPDAILRLEKITKHYDGAGSVNALPVLRDVSLSVMAGESLAIIGPSGSGKTTLLNIIGALDEPTSGRVLLAGQDIAALNENHRAEVRNRQIGFVFQSHHLLPQCTALENVLVPTLAASTPRAQQNSRHTPCAVASGRDPLDAHGHSAIEEVAQVSYGTRSVPTTEDRARRLLDRVGLKERINHRPGQLSGGERQRVAVVRALINQPQLLIADEPTGALDAAAAGELAQLLVDLNREENVTLIVVTHNENLASRMKRTLILQEGTLKDRKP